jgi:signal transduction histidine kinase
MSGGVEIIPLRWHRKKDKTVFPVEISGSCFYFRQKKILIAVIRDISQRKQEELFGKLTTDVLEILNSSLGWAHAINKILLVIKKEINLDAVGIRLQAGFSNDSRTTEHALMVRDGHVCAGCVCGLVIAGKVDLKNPLFTKKGSFWTNNSLSLLGSSAYRNLKFYPHNCCIKKRFLGIALIPIRANGEIVGLLQLNTRSKNFFSLKIIHYFEEISAYLGVALMRKRAEQIQCEATEQSKIFSQSLLAVREEEKKKLSANLHDELGGLSVALNANLSIIQSDLERKEYKNAAKNIRKTKFALEKGMVVFRKIAEELRPPNLDVVGLTEVLREKFSQKARDCGLSISFKLPSKEKKLSDRVATAIYRVTQEALTNIIKYAKARKVTVQLRYRADQLLYTISDDGQGFEVDGALKGAKIFKLGILGMRERIESLGGTFSIESVMREGTTIRITVPIPGRGGLKNEYNGYYSG